MIHLISGLFFVDFINEWPEVLREESETKALKTMIAQAKGECLPAGYVPQTYLFLWDEDEIIGQFCIRHFLCESLIEGLGHISYYIGKKFRGKGYGTKGLTLTLQIAKEIIPEDEIYLRVNKNNLASLHVMLNNRGYIHHEAAKHYYVRIDKVSLK